MANRVLLLGRVATEPELKYTPSGIAVANFRIAVDRPFQNQSGERETDFFTVKVWREQAERVANHLLKGQLVVVDGRLEYRTWDAPDGTKRSTTEVVANSVTFQDSAQMMFAVIATSNQMVSEALRYLNRVPAEGGPREEAGERPAYAGRSGGGFNNDRPQAAPGGFGGAPMGAAGSAGGPSDEPDFGDPFADQ